MTRPEGRSHRFRAVRPIRRQTGPTDPAGYPLICVPGQFSGETGKAAPIEDPASRGASFGIEGGIAELSARTAFADGTESLRRLGSNVDHSMLGRTDTETVSLNWHDVVIVTTSRAERVGQHLNQDAWDQVIRQLIKNLL